MEQVLELLLKHNLSELVAELKINIIDKILYSLLKIYRIFTIGRGNIRFVLN
jgi:hypothetical protein